MRGGHIAKPFFTPSCCLPHCCRATTNSFDYHSKLGMILANVITPAGSGASLLCLWASTGDASFATRGCNNRPPAAKLHVVKVCILGNEGAGIRFLFWAELGAAAQGPEPSGKELFGAGSSGHLLTLPAAFWPAFGPFSFITPFPFRPPPNSLAPLQALPETTGFITAETSGKRTNDILFWDIGDESVPFSSLKPKTTFARSAGTGHLLVWLGVPGLSDSPSSELGPAWLGAAPGGQLLP